MSTRDLVGGTAAAACAVWLLASAGCSSPGEKAQAEPAVEQVAAIRVDAATAVRLRTLADASVDAASRSFGPAEGLPLDVLGARLFRSRGCIECHGPGVDDPVGPDLINAFGTMRPVEDRPALLMDLDYINVALMRPDSLVAEGYSAGVMPSYEGTLYPREVLALAVYLQGMSDAPEAPEQGISAEVPAPEADEPTPVERIESPLIEEIEEPAAASEEEQADETPTRSDGRPDWWFDGVRRSDGRSWTCVEALGDSFASTRKATLDRGLVVLGERLGLPPSAELNDPRVKYIWGTPLPNRGVGQRYAGYAMMSTIAD